MHGNVLKINKQNQPNKNQQQKKVVFNCLESARAE